MIPSTPYQLKEGYSTGYLAPSSAQPDSVWQSAWKPWSPHGYKDAARIGVLHAWGPDCFRRISIASRAAVGWELGGCSYNRDIGMPTGNNCLRATRLRAGGQKQGRRM